jgi:hypothetical protein
MGDSHSSSYSVLSSILIILVAACFGALESGTIAGAGLAAVVCFVAFIAVLIGIIPIVGQLIYVFVFWPAIIGTFQAWQPTVQISTTLTIIFVVTLIYTILLSGLVCLFVLVKS